MSRQPSRVCDGDDSQLPPHQIIAQYLYNLQREDILGFAEDAYEWLSFRVAGDDDEGEVTLKDQNLWDANNPMSKRRIEATRFLVLIGVKQVGQRNAQHFWVISQ